MTPLSWAAGLHSWVLLPRDCLPPWENWGNKPDKTGQDRWKGWFLTNLGVTSSLTLRSANGILISPIRVARILWNGCNNTRQLLWNRYFRLSTHLLCVSPIWRLTACELGMIIISKLEAQRGWVVSSRYTEINWMSWDSIPSICNSLTWVLTTMLYSDFSMWPKRKHLGRRRLPLSCSVIRTSPGFWTWLVFWPDGPPLNYPGTAGGMWMNKPVVWQSLSHQKKQMWLPKMSHPKKGHGKQLEICVQIDRFNFLPP